MAQSGSSVSMRVRRIAIWCCLAAIGAVVCQPGRPAASPRTAYFQAESCYKALRADPDRMQYRHNWLRCIRKFEAVYKGDPDGEWAAAGLYMSGRLHVELYKRSYLSADKQEAVDVFERIVKRFPESGYREKARRELAALKSSGTAKRTAAASKPSAAPSRGDPKNMYVSADACFRSLAKSRKQKRYRHNWERCLDKARAVTHTDPDGPWAAAGLFLTGEIYEGLYGESGNRKDLTAAVGSYRQIRRQHPDSRYYSRAGSAIARITGDAPPSAPKGASDPVAQTISKATETNGLRAGTGSIASVPSVRQSGMITVTGLRYWSNPSYTRVVIDADDETAYIHRLLKRDPAIKKPQRLFVDMANSVLGDVERTVPINDNLLSDARAGQYTSDTVRVVIDIKSFKNYKIFSLKNPFRVVIDVWGEEKDGVVASAPGVATGSGKHLPPSALAKQLALGVRRIVIDPGHGGKDYGAPGYLKGVHEKQIVLSIGKRLARKIEAELGCEAILTRTGDQYLTLEERTAFANTQNADLFISIHTNSHRDRRAYGIETYFLNLATDNEAIMVAATENATSEKNISDLQTILLDLMQNAKINESSRLAIHVQDAMASNMKRKYSRIKNKGVKQAPFYVLLGAQMPAILIETSFISNKRECQRLVDPSYQEALCDGIVAGIRKYIAEISPMAVYAPPPRTASDG